MHSSSSTGPRVAYLDTCIASALAKGELSSDDSRALARMGELVAASKLTLWTSTVMKDELDRIPTQHRQPHLDAYNALKVVAAHPTTTWIDEDPASPTYQQQTVHPVFANLNSILPHATDALHVFQASMNSIPDFITIDQRTLLRFSTKVTEAAAVNVWSPHGYMSNWTT